MPASTPLPQLLCLLTALEFTAPSSIYPELSTGYSRLLLRNCTDWTGTSEPLAQPHLALTLPEFYTPCSAAEFVAFSLQLAILVTLDKSLSCSRPPPLTEKRTQKD